MLENDCIVKWASLKQRISPSTFLKKGFYLQKFSSHSKIQMGHYILTKSLRRKLKAFDKTHTPTFKKKS